MLIGAYTPIKIFSGYPSSRTMHFLPCSWIALVKLCWNFAQCTKKKPFPFLIKTARLHLKLSGSCFQIEHSHLRRDTLYTRTSSTWLNLDSWHASPSITTHLIKHRTRPKWDPPTCAVLLLGGADGQGGAALVWCAPRFTLRLCTEQSGTRTKCGSQSQRRPPHSTDLI